MAAGDSLKRMVPSKSATTTTALPPFQLPRLPDRIARIAGDDYDRWHDAVNLAMQNHFQLLEEKLNVVINAQKTGG